MKDQEYATPIQTYQQDILKFNVCPEERRLPHALTGLTAEVGELMALFQKHYRGDGPLKTDLVIKEMGGVLYYLADLATVLGLDLGAIAAANVAQLEDRAARGVIKGNGDNR